MATCLEVNCDRVVIARGLCAKHYDFRKRHGTLPPKVVIQWTGCSVEGCTSTLKGGRGMCSRHYQRLTKRGTLEQPLKTADPEVRFWSFVDIRGPISDYAPQLGPCWMWTGRIKDDYGRFNHQGRMEGAHRFVYELVVGPIPFGLHIDHLCRNPPCVNPGHLEPVTPAVNNQRVPVTPERRQRLSENGKKGAAARWGKPPTG